MIENILDRLIKAYKASPSEFHATSYWSAYEKPILRDVARLDLNELRSGKYNSFKTFGFNEVVFSYPPGIPVIKRSLLKLIHNHIIGKKNILPYGLGLSDIRDMAYRHCELYGELTNSGSIKSIEADTFGNPADLFTMNGKDYTMFFLNYYLRYCFQIIISEFRGMKRWLNWAAGPATRWKF
jgi:hypothetical protein